MSLRPDQVMAVFKGWDLSGRGKISKADLATIMRKLNPSFKPESLKVALAEAGATEEGDGVDYSAFVSWVFSTQAKTATPEEIDCYGSEMIWAACTGQLERVRELLAEGADVNSFGKYQNTPLRAAAAGRGPSIR